MKSSKKGNKLLLIDKVMITIIILIGILIPVSTVYSKSILQDENIEVERLKSKIAKQKNINESLEMQIDELASLNNIQGIAKEYGLSYNNENIIVINN